MAARNPTPAEIKAAREAAEQTQPRAGQTILGSHRAWQSYEAAENEPGHRRMHPGLLLLYRVLTKQITVKEARKAVGLES